MIKRILTYYASRLDEYLRHKFPQPEGVAATVRTKDPAN